MHAGMHRIYIYIWRLNWTFIAQVDLSVCPLVVSLEDDCLLNGTWSSQGDVSAGCVGMCRMGSIWSGPLCCSQSKHKQNFIPNWHHVFTPLHSLSWSFIRAECPCVPESSLFGLWSYSKQTNSKPSRPCRIQFESLALSCVWRVVMALAHSTWSYLRSTSTSLLALQVERHEDVSTAAYSI